MNIIDAAYTDLLYRAENLPTNALFPPVYVTFAKNYCVRLF